MDRETRFWNKVDVLSEDECWEWLASPRCFFRTDDGVVSAKRFSWFITFGDVPENVKVYSRPTCKKNCVNPNHLRLSTNKDEFIRIGKRDQRGEKNPNAKLSQRDVDRIRRLGKRFELNSIARAFPHVTRDCIFHILKGNSWK